MLLKQVLSFCGQQNLLSNCQQQKYKEQPETLTLQSLTKVSSKILKKNK